MAFRPLGGGVLQAMYLLLFHGQDAHGTGFGADAAGYALAGRLCFRGHDHDVHGAGFHAFAAAYALLFVDHVHALRVLGDRALRTRTGALAAHDAAVDLRLAVRLGGDADAAQIGVKLFVKSFRTRSYTGQARLAGVLFAYG